MLTDDHESVIRSRVNGNYLYLGSDAKLANWLGIEESEVSDVVDGLIAEGVLCFLGLSRTGSRKYRLLPAGTPDAAVRLYRRMVEDAAVGGIVDANSSDELARLAGLSTSECKSAFGYLQRRGLVDTDEIDGRRLPVVAT
ncbi:hypothetical protein GV791_04245 [Nocardia cyriacigeorgica]|uniref:Uncharacterized protein n=1 Tax=Nocardia cyriacigeorgica TaxID=135487 RepID=A0A6P1CGN3_9NOCA|nr:hypothetical protein [Nocardia cyriacigeorgica]MBF6425590.1 hypothetical protein [Nocardia cyriacigeorgica]NEW31771.1 hypothetical protein [Nocardia cyriacigeorgica]